MRPLEGEQLDLGCAVALLRVHLAVVGLVLLPRALVLVRRREYAVGGLLGGGHLFGGGHLYRSYLACSEPALPEGMSLGNLLAWLLSMGDI